MAKATKPLGGTTKDKYFRDLLAGDPGVSPDAVKRLAETTKREVAEVRVRTALADERMARAAATKADAAKAGTSTADAAPKPPTESAATAAAKSAPAQSTTPVAAATAPQPAFDPFAFTAVVVLKRQGPAALEKLLSAIADADNLRLLADKQHLGLPADATSAAELRAAILASAQARITDRRAAAS